MEKRGLKKLPDNATLLTLRTAMSVAEIAVAYGVTKAAVYLRLAQLPGYKKRTHRGSVVVSDAYLEELAKQNKSLEEIHYITELSRSSIFYRLGRLGWRIERQKSVWVKDATSKNKRETSR